MLNDLACAGGDEGVDRFFDEFFDRRVLGSGSDEAGSVGHGDDGATAHLIRIDFDEDADGRSTPAFELGGDGPFGFERAGGGGVV